MDCQFVLNEKNVNYSQNEYLLLTLQVENMCYSTGFMIWSNITTDHFQNTL